MTLPPEFKPEIATFQWDDGNSEKNLRRHGVTQEEAERVFYNRPFGISDASPVSPPEQRYVAFGHTNTGEGITVVFTIRGDRVRVISARPMSRRERLKYGPEDKS